MIYDVFVIGLGPAGANFCSNISEKYSVFAVDSRKFENGVYTTSKCCGGMLNEDSQEALIEENLVIDKDVITTPQSFVVKTYDKDNDLIRQYKKPYLNINRDKFDSFLLKRVSSNVSLNFNTKFSSFEKVKDYYLIKIKSGKNVEFVKARYIVDASGSVSILRSKLFKNDSIEKYYALQRWYKKEDLPKSMLAVFDSRITDYYGWGVPKDGAYLLGLASKFNGNINVGFDIMLKDLNYFGLDFGSDYKREASIIFRPKFNKDIFLCNENVFFIGESAGLISPSSSEGISYAIRSGRYLAQSMNESIDDFKKQYFEKIKKLKYMIFTRNLKSSVMYGFKGELRNIIMKSNLLHIKSK
ncbi:MAG: hypothetical protein CSB15_00670 [Clostridiales bacterium]|nr:MAG: hypothetical protein CSB15_00670 [Clostridiales bacterium]